jgi:hypothetical protein
MDEDALVVYAAAEPATMTPALLAGLRAADS